MVSVNRAVTLQSAIRFLAALVEIVEGPLFCARTIDALRSRKHSRRKVPTQRPRVGCVKGHMPNGNIRTMRVVCAS